MLFRSLIVPAVVVLSMIALVGALNRDAATLFATYAATAMALVWGCVQASGSFLSEVAGRTWDTQRGSSLSGWQMTWGKLFGATAYSWYGVAAVFVAWLALDGLATPTRAQWLYFVPAAVLAQAVALTGALYLAIDGRIRARSTRQAAVLGALAGFVAMQTFAGMSRGRVEWYEVDAEREAIVVGSALFLCGWGVVGAWRTMAAALQIPLRAWAWPLFLVTGAAWIAGFVTQTLTAEPMARRLHLAFGFAWCATWVAALVDSKSPVRLRQWAAELSRGDLGRLISHTPSWAVGMPVVVAAAVGVALVSPKPIAVPVPADSVSFLGPLFRAAVANNPVWLTVTGLLLFLVRDIGVMYWAGLVGRGRRVPALLYLAILYVLIPAVLVATSQSHWAAAFVPLPFADGAGDAALWLLIAEAAVATALAGRAVRRATRLDV